MLDLILFSDSATENTHKTGRIFFSTYLVDIALTQTLILIKYVLCCGYLYD